MSLTDNLQSINKKAGGSHLTIENRSAHLRGFANWCKDKNYQIQTVEQIKEKHILGFMDYLKDKNSERTRQGKLSALRVVIRESGKSRFANSIKTQAMGVQKASRDGTKRAITDQEFNQALAKVQQKDPGCAAAMQLCRDLGLRRQEAVMADASTLKRWAQQIERGLPVSVVRGTKGGHRRSAAYPSQERAKKAVEAALKVAGNGYIVKTDSLKQSVKKMSNIAASVGLKGEISLHSLRYAFACERLDQLMQDGYSRRHAAVDVSLDLGHGDGRGAYIQQVYSRR
jgi:site-specific recombinase XerD